MAYDGPNPYRVRAGGTGRSTLTDHAILVGNVENDVTLVGPSSTSGQVLQSQGAAADPAYSTATYPSTTTVSQILYSSATNTVSGLATANKAVLTTGATGVPVLTALATDGQLIIGSTAGVPAAATLTAGSGITITNASNSITIAATGGAGTVTTLTGNTGGAISPTAGNINTVGTGSITIAGSGSTLTTQLTGLTAHNVLIGQGTTTIGLVAPSATGGVPLVSNGAGSDPDFSTAQVVGGGTGAVSFTAYSVICAGTTSTGMFQNVSGLGSVGQVLTSNGAGALPTWQVASSPSGFTQIATQVFTSNGTYTPTASMKYCIIECVGGGAAGGGVINSTNGAGTGGGGGSGGYSRKIASAANIGVSKPVTIGSGGTGSSGGGGGAGGTTSVGALCIALGGIGGQFGYSGGAGDYGQGASTGTGDFVLAGNNGASGMAVNNLTNVAATLGASGASSYFGGGAPCPGQASNAATPGLNATNYGAGGSGATNHNSINSAAGGNGSAGIVVITEFI